MGRDFILQNLMWKDVFIVILKEKHQNSCGKKLLDAFFVLKLTRKGKRLKYIETRAYLS